MADVKIRIESKAIDDAYFRSHGMAVDETLDKQFWSSQSNLVIGTAGKSFSYEVSLELEPGRHTIEYGVSAWVGTWDATIHVNDTVAAQGITDVNSHLVASFVVGPMGKAFPLKIPVLNIGILRFPSVLSMMRGRMRIG